MDMKEEMMSDAVDDVMDDEEEGEGEEAEGDKVLREVLDEIGIDMGQMVSLEFLPFCLLISLVMGSMEGNTRLAAWERKRAKEKTPKTETGFKQEDKD